MFKHLAVFATALSLSAMVFADDPNVEPGLWEYTVTTVIEGDWPVPDQTHTTQECLTLEEIRSGHAMLDDVDECDVQERDIRRDGMTLRMVCNTGDGGELTMSADMQFMGQRIEGDMRGSMNTPMGPMNMVISQEGRRIGDC